MQNQSKILNIPTAIIIAGAIIAGSIIYTTRNSSGVQGNNLQAGVVSQEIQLKPVNSSDHILGNPNAKIKIVEYSDISCPYCKTFHATMVKIMDEYGKSGNVAWIYRHFPIDKPDAAGRILHPNAGNEAQALECAADLGGNSAFWAYTNRLYEVTPSVTSSSPGGLDQSRLPEIAEEVGLDVDRFRSCLASDKFKEKIEGQFTDGINAGIEGTPSSFIVTPAGKIIPVAGARPFDDLKRSIDALLLDTTSKGTVKIE